MITRKLDNLLVTGGCGFIGSAFIRRMFRDRTFKGTITNLDKLTYAGNVNNVLGHVDEQRYQLVRGDILDSALVGQLCQDRHVDAIVHFAAESHVDRSIDGPLVFIETNVVGTAKLLEVVRAQPHLHFHHVSTDEVYGSLGASGAFHESSPYDPRSPYSASKASSDHLVRAYAHTFGLSVTISNCSNNYGPYQFPEKLIPLVILNLVERKPLPIYGDGGNVRDWLHVDDHVDAIWAILQRGAQGETYNVGGNSERTNLQLIDLLIAAVSDETGCAATDLEALKTFVPDRPGHDRRYAIDATKLAKTLAFLPQQSLGVGLRETVRWYLSNQRWLQSVRTGEYRNWMDKNYSERGRPA
ncbi:MAG TPA: dTDP-glucose 4,6-dehydratase [Polyangiaceae bacterium]